MNKTGRPVPVGAAKKLTRWAFLCLVLTWLMGVEAFAGQEHPFLICKREQFQTLRNRASKSPWKEMKEDALEIAAMDIQKIGDGALLTTKQDRLRIQRIKEADARRAKRGKPNPKRSKPQHAPVRIQGSLGYYFGACALSYILEKGKESLYAKKVHHAIVNQLKAVHFGRGTNGWDGCVPPMCVAFNAIVALDIVYDDLTPAQIKACEEVIETQINKIGRNSRSWPTARLGTHGTWDIYKGTRTTPDDRYYGFIMEQITEDGVATRSPGYAYARILGTGDRMQKAAYMDVLEFTGIDKRYYKDERISGFYEWLFSSGINPAHALYLFGDMHPKKTRVDLSNVILTWRIGRFSKTAAAHAVRFLEDIQPPGHVVPYVTMTEPLPEPASLTSRLYMKGGAFFCEKEDAPYMALGGALYNITSGVGFHTHQEVNALGLCAYGNNLLVNGGWLAPSTRPASKNNTLAINGGNHRSMAGAGIEEGLVGPELDYACGLSGKALGDDSFARSLILMHGGKKQGGYFLVIDEVDADAGEKVHTYLQTASENPVKEVSPRCEYRATINHHTPMEGVEMSVFYGTEPVEVKQDDLPSSTSPGFGNHRRLEAIYDTNAEGNRQILKVLYPHDATHSKADMERLQEEGFEGVKIGAEDSVYLSDGTADCKIGSQYAFQAKVLVMRADRRSLDFYFVRKGRKFYCKKAGFKSDAPISLFMKDKSGTITSKGATVVFKSTGIKGISLNGKAIPSKMLKSGYVEAAIPEGRHEVTLTKRAFSASDGRAK